MGTLTLTPNVPGADDVYAMLIEAHEGKTKADSEAFNARLILTLINHIGDADIIAQALKVAEG